MRKKSYYNGIDDYMQDNFPILLNDDLQSSMDRKENDVSEEEDDKKENEEEETGETLLEPTPFRPYMYSSQPGIEGVFSIPLADYPGNLGAEESGAIVNNPYNSIYQSNGLLASRELERIADLFIKLATKIT